MASRQTGRIGPDEPLGGFDQRMEDGRCVSRCRAGGLWTKDGRESERRAVCEEKMQHFRCRATFSGEQESSKPESADRVMAFAGANSGGICKIQELRTWRYRKLASDNKIARSQCWLFWQ